MTPDDPRHGKLAGRVAGCRCPACRAAKVAYEKRRAHEAKQGRPRLINAVGTHRRIRALMFMGWTQAEIARRLGMKSTKNINDFFAHPDVLRTTAERIAAIYDELSMVQGPSNRIAVLARNRGYAPPLAWDEATIDDPDAKPYRPKKGANPELHMIDPVIVDRALAGERVKANTAERAEVVRRWLAAGRSLKSLNEAQGWNAERDRRRDAA